MPLQLSQQNGHVPPPYPHRQRLCGTGAVCWCDPRERSEGAKGNLSECSKTKNRESHFMDLGWPINLGTEAESIHCGSPSTHAYSKVKDWAQHSRACPPVLISVLHPSAQPARVRPKHSGQRRHQPLPLPALMFNAFQRENSSNFQPQFIPIHVTGGKDLRHL